MISADLLRATGYRFSSGKPDDAGWSPDQEDAKVKEQAGREPILSQNGLVAGVTQGADEVAAAGPAPHVAKSVEDPTRDRRHAAYMASADGRLVYQLSQLPFVKSVVVPRVLFYHQ
jgi:hypothetical protein